MAGHANHNALQQENARLGRAELGITAAVGYVDKQRAKDLLGAGLSTEVVGRAMGVNASVISQMLADPDFAAEVTELRITNLNAANARDRKLDALEDRAIEKMEESIDSIYKPNDILRTLSAINALRRRGVPAHAAVSAQQDVVELEMPTVIKDKLTISKNGEVVAVGEKMMITMPANQLLKELSSSKSEKDDDDKYKKVARYLDGSSITNTGLIVENDARKD